MIIASLATMPGREAACRAAVESLRKQVDAVYVYDNGKQVDLGDAGKFAAEPWSGYHLTCDDDLLYAPDYVQHMIAAVERYGRKAVVSLHGRRIQTPMTSYYRDRAEKFRCLERLDLDEPVHIVGTGCMAYHTDTIRFSLADFPLRNMADIHASVVCEMKGIPRIAVAHPEGMVRHLPIDMTTTIYHRHKHDDRPQTERVNSISWGIPCIAA